MRKRPRRGSPRTEAATRRPPRSGKAGSRKARLPAHCARCRRVERLRETVRREKELLRRFSEDSASAIIGIDLDDMIRFWNRGAEAIFGYSGGEAVGQPLSMLIPPELRAAGEPEAIEETVRRDGTVRNFVTERVRKDGKRIMVQFTRTEIRDAGGRPIGSTAVVTDITELLQIRERLERERALSAIGQTVASIAHDLRSPIQTVRSAAEILRSKAREPDTVKVIARDLEASMGTIERLVDDLLAFSRDQKPVRIPTPVSMILEATAEEMRGALPDGVDCLFQVPPEGALLPCDAFKVKAALANLIRNSAEAMTGGGTVTIGAREDGGQWILEVADTGPGIARELHQKIFEPFYTTKQKGTGLGLSIVRKIVDAHQGNVEIESAVGHGTKVRLTFPITPKKG